MGAEEKEQQVKEREIKLALKVFSERPVLASPLQVKHGMLFTRLQGSTCKHTHPGYANTDAKVLVDKCQSPQLKPFGDE